MLSIISELVAPIGPGGAGATRFVLETFIPKTDFSFSLSFIICLFRPFWASTVDDNLILGEQLQYSHTYHELKICILLTQHEGLYVVGQVVVGWTVAARNILLLIVTVRVQDRIFVPQRLRRSNKRETLRFYLWTTELFRKL